MNNPTDQLVQVRLAAELLPARREDDSVVRGARHRFFGLAGLWLGMVVAPTDFQQGEGYRIIFIHVPASWMSMFIYLVMAFWAALGLASTPAWA